MNVSIEHDSCNTTNSTGYKLLPFDATFSILNFLFGIPTHFYTLWLIVTGGGKASEIFTLNISVCEIMICLCSMINVIANEFPRLWDIVWFLSGFAMIGRPLFQCLICVERYLAVVHPVTFLKYKPLRYRVACCTFTWIFILIFCVFYLLSFKLCFAPLYRCFYMAHCSLILSISLFCCVAVLRALKQSGPGERGREREEINHMKRRALHLILITSVTLIITYFPSVIVSFQIILSRTPPPLLDSISRICFIVAGFVQPLLYIHRVGKLPFCTAH